MRGIIRLSGPRAREIVETVWAGGGRLDPPLDLGSRAIHLGRFGDGRGEQPLLLLWMPGPRSYTREDVAEFHLPGSPPLLRAAFARVLALGASPAEPGEFTRRAFLSGRIDLTRAEGVLAVVSARDESERAAGAALLAGGLAGRVVALRERLEDVRALCEASLDFDERDTGHVPLEEIEAGIRSARAALAEALDWEVSRASPGGEPRVVLAGAPNAGKSSLFNRLAGEGGAIVSPLPGTTRDVLAALIEIEGAACRLIDTAGVGPVPPGEGVARAAMGLAECARESADLVVWVVDAADPSGVPRVVEGRWLIAWNKVDLPESRPEPPSELAGAHPWVATSALDGFGVAGLRLAIARALSVRRPGEAAGISRETSLRHRGALVEATRALDEGASAWRAGASLEILAEHLRAVCDSLDAITGETATEAVLDRIFSRFCLGK